MIGTSTGRRHNPSNLRRDVLAKTVTAANVKLAALGIAPIESLTFHGLRRTYASLRCVCGDDVRYTADQLGHEDPRFTLRCYAQASKRRDRLAKPQRQAFDAAVEWAALGTTAPETVEAFDTEATKSPSSGAFLERMMGLEPTTFCMASRRSSQLSYIRERRPV